MTCSICNDIGLVFHDVEERRTTSPCSCRAKLWRAKALAAAEIPERYQDSDLADFGPSTPAGLAARAMVRDFPAERGRNGLLLVGSMGTGKTHLAVATLRALIVERGAHGLFTTTGDMFRRLRSTFSRKDVDEDEVFRRYAERPVLVLDDVGQEDPKDWAFDTLSNLISARYNACLPTIVTTNFPHGRSGGRAGLTLGDRIGDVALDRLSFACTLVKMNGLSRRSDQ